MAMRLGIWFIQRMHNKHSTAIRHIKFRRVLDAVANKKFFFRHINIREVLHAGNGSGDGLTDGFMLLE